MAALATALTIAPNLTAKENDTLRELLEISLKEKKGVMLYFKGQSIGGIVTRIDGDTVELRSREYSRVAVRIDAIDAIALS
jgi:endonuclease YncB( thermonuclease family)